MGFYDESGLFPLSLLVMSAYDNEWQAILPLRVMGRHYVSMRLVYADKHDKDFSTLLYFSNLE